MGQEKYGVLLVNLGTPNAPTAKEVKRYLREFLSDSRVIDIPKVLWWPLLNGVILPLRAKRVAKLYRAIWQSEGSPLLVYSRLQQQALAGCLPNVSVVLAMSYGQPSLVAALESLLGNNVTKLVILPLYPQYSCSTTAAVWDGVARVLKRYRCLPSLSFVRDYADHPAYIDALVESIKRAFDKHGKPDCLLLSFHGIPMRYVRLGDDYPRRCEATYAQLAAKLPLKPQQIMLSYQSRFGREAWLTPYTDEVIKSLPAQGVKHLQVICPGFAADCLETLEEINVQNREFFLTAGGEKFEYIPALNDLPAHIEMLRQLVMEAL